MPCKIVISYDGTAADRFDRRYYDEKHIPKVLEAWAPFGLEDIRAFFPERVPEKRGTVGLCECVFRDRESMEAAFNAPCTAKLIDDIPNFTALRMQVSELTPADARDAGEGE